MRLPNRFTVLLASALKHPNASLTLDSLFPIDVDVSTKKIISAFGMHCAVVTVLVAVVVAVLDSVVVPEVVNVVDILLDAVVVAVVEREVVADEDCVVVGDVVIVELPSVCGVVVGVVDADAVAVVETLDDCVDDGDVVAETVTVVDTVLETVDDTVEVGVDDAVDDCVVDADVVAVVVAVVRHSNRGMYESTSSRTALFKCTAFSSSSVHCSSEGDWLFFAIEDSNEYCPGNGSSASTKLYTSRVASANGEVAKSFSISLLELRDLASVTITTIKGTAPYRYPCVGWCCGGKNSSLSRSNAVAALVGCRTGMSANSRRPFLSTASSETNFPLNRA